MEFLKALFTNGEALTFDQLAEKVKAAKLSVVDISHGEYVSRAKYDDDRNALKQQVTDLQGQITQRDTDMTELQKKLTTAQADASKLGEAQQSLTDLQTKYDAEKKAYDDKLARQAYEFAVREKANGLQFSSNAAKRAFIQDANTKEFKLDGDTLLGFDDYVAKYKADDPEAFKPESDPNAGNGSNGTNSTGTGDNGGNNGKAGQPSIVLPNGTGKPNGGSADLFHFAFNGVRSAPKSGDQ